MIHGTNSLRMHNLWKIVVLHYVYFVLILLLCIVCLSLLLLLLLFFLLVNPGGALNNAAPFSMPIFKRSQAVF